MYMYMYMCEDPPLYTATQHCVTVLWRTHPTFSNAFCVCYYGHPFCTDSDLYCFSFF